MASAVLTATPETSLSKSLVIGSCAHFLGKRAEENKSHEWSVYIRSTSPDEDPSLWIKRVVFQLHPTLQPPTRGTPRAHVTPRHTHAYTMLPHLPPNAFQKVPLMTPARLHYDGRRLEWADCVIAVIDTAPFEVTEQGWGEFEIHCQVFFQDSKDKPLELSHMLKLYPDTDQGPNTTSKPVVSERYDELVFNDPSEGLRARLTADVQPSNKGWRNSPNAKWFTDFDAEGRHEELQQVYQVITAELQNASKRRLQMEEELRML